MFTEDVTLRRYLCVLANALFFSPVSGADELSADTAEQASEAPAIVSKAFDAAEMDRVYAKLGVSGIDQDYLHIEGIYTIENGERRSNVLEIIPKALHVLGKLCVVNVQLRNVRISETELEIYQSNVWMQRVVGLGESQDRCASITYETLWEDRYLAPSDIDLETVLIALENQKLYFSAVGEFSNIPQNDVSDELELAQIFSAEDYDENADLCVSVFRSSTTDMYQVCVVLKEKELEVNSVGHFVHKYDKLTE